MASYISSAPAWVIVVFIPVFLYTIAFIAIPAKQAALNAGMTPAKAKKIQFGLYLFCITYLIYAAVLALKGVFATNAIPPRAFFFTTIPLSILLFAIVGNTGLFKTLLRSATLESLIAIHKYRFISVFFIILYYYRLVNPGFALLAGLGDMATAIGAYFVSKRVAEGRPGSIKATYAWSILGTLDVIAVLVMAAMIAAKSIAKGGHGDPELAMFPFVWFPAFAPAIALFLHTAVFRKLSQIE